MSKDKFVKLIEENLENKNIDELPKDSGGFDINSPRTKRMKTAKWIPIDKIQPDIDQPRKNFNESSLNELAQSIKEYGIRQPIIVEYIQDKDHFRIVSGERRYKASQIVGLNEMPSIVQEKVDKAVRFAQQLVENIQREDFSPIDKARALLEYKEIMGKDTPGLKIERKVGISETRRKQFVSLLNLPEKIQSEIVAIGKRPSKNQITEKHARALLMLNKMPEKQVELFKLITKSNTSLIGDEAIEIAKNIKGVNTYKTFSVKYQSGEELIQKLEEALANLKST